jgi:hypothetical protein
MSGSETDIQWFIARDGKQHGPVSDTELKKIVELAHLKPTDLVWRQGFTDWRAASSVFPELAAPAPTPASPAPKPPTSSPAASSPAPAPNSAKPLSPTAPSASPATTAPSPQPAAPAAARSQQTPFGAPSRDDSWRAPNEPTLRAEPNTAARTLGGPAQRGPGPGPQPGPMPHADLGAARPTPRATTDSRRPSELSAQPRSEPNTAPPGRGKRLALVAVGLAAMTGLGAWLSSHYTEDVFTYVHNEDGTASEQQASTQAASGADNKPTATAAIPTATTTEAPSGSPTSDDIDRRLQGRSMWVAIKQDFPEWYQARVTDLTKLSTEQKPQTEIDHYVVNALVALRRENAKFALAASTARHKELAGAFLANLNRLSQESGDSCYDFISKGELSNTIVERIGDPAKSSDIDAQIAATLAAISEGRSQPTEHAAPVKTDYDVLAGELGRLGWTQADMQLFANPKELAQAPRGRVCNMLKDWFTAHLAIQDPATQGRLLFETLKPVISG